MQLPLRISPFCNSLITRSQDVWLHTKTASWCTSLVESQDASPSPFPFPSPGNGFPLEMAVLVCAEDFKLHNKALEKKWQSHSDMKEQLAASEKQVSQPPVLMLTTMCLSVYLSALSGALHSLFLVPLSSCQHWTPHSMLC